MRLVRKPFRGSHFYEWQIGPFVFQIRHAGADGTVFAPFHVWRDPYWK